MRKTKYPPDKIEEICLEALKDGKSMSRAVALYFNVDTNISSTLIAKVRSMGYDIPVLRTIDQTEWEEKRRQHVEMRKRLIYGGTSGLLDKSA